MITPNSIDSLTTAESAADAVATPKRGSIKPSATKAEPHPLALELDALKRCAAVLASDVENQKVRLRDLEKVTAEKCACLDDIEEERTDFHTGSDRAAELTKSADMLSWLSNKKGISSVADYHQLRSRALDLKNGLLATLNLAAGAAVQARQEEIAGLLAGWAGTDAPTSPVPVSLIAAACPVIHQLEALRINLEACKMDAGLAALTTVGQAALDMLAILPVTEPRPALYGGFTQRSHGAVFGWNGSDPRLDLLAVFDTPAEASAYYTSLRARSGFVGFTQIVRFEESHPNNEFHYVTENAPRIDQCQNAASGCTHSCDAGTTEGFLAEASAWLKA